MSAAPDKGSNNVDKGALLAIFIALRFLLLVTNG
jgi:hypothetical protein